MSVFRQKGRKIWQARVWAPELGRVRSVSTGTEDRIEALRIAAELAAMAAGVASRARVEKFLAECGHRRAPGLPIGAAWEQYAQLPDTRRLSARELEVRRQRWGVWARWAAGRGLRNAGDVGAREALAFWDWLRSGERSGKTCNHYRAALGAIWEALRERWELPGNPWRAVRTAAEDDSRGGRALTAEEVARLLAVAPWPYSGAMVASLYTGLRLADLLRLDWAAVGGGWIDLRPSKTRRHGIRVRLPIHPELAGVLERARAETGGAGLVFPRLRAQLRVEGHARRQFQRLLELAGIEPEPGEVLTFHCLRHTFRTRLAAAGVGQDVAMRLGGWRSAAMADHYNHDEESLRRAIAALR